MMTTVGRRILFKNILNKDSNTKYEWPANVNFDEKVKLDPTNQIDLGIMIEEKVLETYGKMPE